jgi:hypothetical protein
MAQLHIEAVGGRKAFWPGETVELVVGWELEREPESVEIRAGWTTLGKGTQDLKVVKAESVESPKALDARRVSFVLPSEPYSFSGKLVSLVWFLEVVALPSKEGTHIDIVIAPGENEVMLHGYGKAPP